MSLKFYHAPYSTAGITVAVLAELEAAHGKTLAERIEVTLHDGTRKPEFLAINPNGFVPAIVHNDVPIWESAAITMYLGEQFGVEHHLYPPPSTCRGLAMKWIVWSNVNLPLNARAISKVMHGKGDEPEDVMKVRKADAETAREELAKQLAVLDGGLKGKQYLLGEDYCLADTHIWSFMSYIKMLGVDLEKTPDLKAWIDRVGAREQLKGL